MIFYYGSARKCGGIILLLAYICKPIIACCVKVFFSGVDDLHETFIGSIQIL